MLGKWYFESVDAKWNMTYRAIFFNASKDGETFVFAVSQIALNDYFETPDTKENAFENFKNNIGRIENVAVRLANEVEPNKEAPHFFIKLEHCQKYSL